MKKNNAKSGRKIFSNKGSSPTPHAINTVVTLFNEGRFAEAAPLAQSMTMRFPLHGFSWTVLGTVLMNMGRIADALAPMQKAAALLPDNPDMHNNLSIVLRDLGRLDEAEASCRRALQIKPDFAKAQYILGIILRDLGRLGEAEQFLRKAVLLDPESIEYRFNLANFLATFNRSGDVDEAKSIFLEVIKAEPTHLEAWNNLGRLLFDTGYTSAARTAYSAAVTYHPREAIAHVNLGSVLLDMGDLPAAEKHFKIALDLNPDLANAHQGLASISHRLGLEDESCHHRDMGFGKQPISTLAYRGRGKPIQLLVLGSALEGNIPWRFLIDSNVFQTTIIAVEYFDTQLPLPLHQLIINAIGDADLCQNGLEIANQLIKKSQAPIINRPDAVLQTGRLMNAQRLGILLGVVAPRMALVSKTDIISGQALEMLADKEFTFPLLLRSPGFQGGNYFVCVDGPNELNSAVEELPGESQLAIEFIDSRSEDRLFRKYRVMSINGSFYPIHLAISAHWKVHYVTSDMSNNAKYRNEEDAFLNDFSTFLGSTAITVLERISQALGLDYCGIDFGMDKNGNILLYEANSTMVFNPPTHEKQWDYKRAAIENALAATKRMFLERVSLTSSPTFTLR
jgi:tetratricopeptide (TPR) repeat protein